MNYTVLSIHGNRISCWSILVLAPKPLNRFQSMNRFRSRLLRPLDGSHRFQQGCLPPPCVVGAHTHPFECAGIPTRSSRSDRLAPRNTIRHHGSNNNPRSPLRSPSPIKPAHVPYRSLLLRQARFPCGEADHLSAAGSGQHVVHALSLAARLQTTA